MRRDPEERGRLPLAEQRGRGLGRALLERTFEAARRSGILRVELEVYATNTKAITLYERCGFQHEGLRGRARLLDGDTDDIVEMALLFDETCP